MPSFSDRIIKELDEVDFDKEYVYLRNILTKDKDELNKTDLSGPAFRAWRLFARAQKNFDDKKRLADAMRASKKLDALNNSSRKPTDTILKDRMLVDSEVHSAVSEQKDAEHVMLVCEGLAQALGIKKRFIYRPWEKQ